MISPGTERAIQRISDLMPQLINELKRYNDNKAAEKKEAKDSRALAYLNKTFGNMSLNDLLRDMAETLKEETGMGEDY